MMMEAKKVYKQQQGDGMMNIIYWSKNILWVDIYSNFMRIPVNDPPLPVPP